MDDFGTVRLRKKTIEKFKKYSKKTSPSYSETLDFMIAFFRDNDLSPYSTMDASYNSVEVVLKKRLDALIAILRNMESTQLIPTREMLESLFNNVAEPEEEKQPKYIFEEQELSSNEKLLSYYHKQYDKTKKKYYGLRNEFEYVLENAEYVKKSFSKSYYKLNLSISDYEALLLKLKEK